MTSCDTVPVTDGDTGTDSSRESSAAADAVMNLSSFSDDPDALQLYRAENSYRFEALPALPDGASPSSLRTLFFNESGQVCIRASDGKGGYIAALEQDGTLAWMEPYQTIIEKNDTWVDIIGALYRTDDGSIFYTTYPTRYIEGTNSCTIAHVGADGQLIASAALPGTGPNRSMAVLGDREMPLIVVGTSDSICVYDTELQLLADVPGAVTGARMRAPDGKLYAETGWSGQYLCFDPDTMAVDTEAGYPVPSNVDVYAAMFFSAAPSGYDVYYADTKAFWGYRAGAPEAELLCDWQNSSLHYGAAGSALTICAVWDENTLLTEIVNPLTGETERGFLRRVPDADTQRIRVTLAFADSYLASLQYEASDLILNCVANFNRTNETYFIELADYADPLYRPTTYVDHPPAYLTPAFEEAMMRNTAADLIISSGYVREEMQPYLRAGAFADLYDAFRTVLLPCVLSGYQTADGALYALPIGITLHTLITKNDSGIPAEITTESLYAMAEGLGTGQSLFGGAVNSGLVANLTAVTMASFADRQTKTCRFDTEAFADLIRFCENLDAYRAAGNGMYMESDGRYLSFGSAEYTERLRNGDIVLGELTLDNLNVFGSLYYLYDGWNFTLHGYPTETGEKLPIDSGYDIHINADSAVSRGAAEFAAYLLSDHVQNSDSIAQERFPVTKNALEQVLAREVFRFNTDTPVLEHTDGSLSVNQFVYSFPLSAWLADGEADVPFPDAVKERLRALFYETQTQSLADSTIAAVLGEELSAYRAGAQTLARTQEILQSRLNLYVNE